MAIKPTDNIIWLNKVGYYIDEPDWHGEMRPTYHFPKYWENFSADATKHLIPPPYSPKATFRERQAHAQQVMGLPQKKANAIKDRLKQYNAEYKESKSGIYLKFKDAGQMMMFMMRWS